MRRCRGGEDHSLPIRDYEEALAKLRHAKVGGVQVKDGDAISRVLPLVDRLEAAQQQGQPFVLA
jgi:hypothetical protein